MNMKQLQKMMKQAQAMQSKIEAEMNELVVEGTSGGGMVTVSVDGKKNVLSVVIKPEAVDPDDVEMLQDLIVAAVNDAGRRVDDKLQSQLGALGGGMLGGM